YASCVDILSICQSLKADLEAVLNPQTGYAPCIRQKCMDQCVSPTKFRGPASSSDEELEGLRLEENTWVLLQVVSPYILSGSFQSNSCTD
ncbi:hypothetical protein HYPSUDRAFT_148640, partial [Hypholoma sublateritium FD-334 SS-4]